MFLNICRNFHRNRDQKGQDGNDAALPTTHENTINQLQLMSSPRAPIRFSSSALDGRLVAWNLGQVLPPEISLASLRLG